MTKERGLAQGQWVSHHDHDGHHHQRERCHIAQDLGYGTKFVTPQVTTRGSRLPAAVTPLRPTRQAHLAHDEKENC